MPNGVKIDRFVNLIKSKNWDELSHEVLAIHQQSTSIINPDGKQYNKAEIESFKRALLEHYGALSNRAILSMEESCLGVDYVIPTSEGLIYKKRVHTKHWVDLLPVDVYFKNSKDQQNRILNNELFSSTIQEQNTLHHIDRCQLPINEETSSLYEKIADYHAIDKHKQESLLLRFKALWDIQNTVERLLKTDSFSAEQKIYLNDILENCKCKSKYIMLLRQMPKRTQQHIFRLEHSKGMPLRINIPNQQYGRYNFEVMTSLDPYHRFISDSLFSEWQSDIESGKTEANLWLWLEKNDIDLEVDDMHIVPKSLFKIEFDHDLKVLAKSHAEYRENTIPDGTYKYNIDRYGNLYVDNHCLVMHHSHLVKGAILCAGMVSFKDGLITSIDNHSGHYMPNKSHLISGIRSLALPREAFSSDANVKSYNMTTGQFDLLGSIEDFLSTSTSKNKLEREEKSSSYPKRHMKPTSKKMGLFFQKSNYKEKCTERNTEVKSGKVNILSYTKPQTITESGAILDRIKTNPSEIMSLSLVYTGYTGWDQDKLSEALLSNTNLKHLALQGRALIEDGCGSLQRFFDALDQNNALESIRIRDIDLDDIQWASQDFFNEFKKPFNQNFNTLKAICDAKNIKLEVFHSESVPSLLAP